MNDRGFSIHESVISLFECDEVVRSIFESGIKIGKGGTRNLMSVDKVSEIANDLRMLNIARSVLGQKSIPFNPTGKGGVIAMSPLLIHASSKAKNDEARRVLHIEYADSLNIAHGIRLAIA